MAVLAEGSNLDDLGDYRPGLRAIEELHVASPLREAGLTKAEIRAISHELGLPGWNKPSCACLASRFAYGEHIDAERLRAVDEAEQLLRSLGFGQLRVRVHGKLARIELGRFEGYVTNARIASMSTGPFGNGHINTVDTSDLL
jgi:uncharacterized protein